MTMEIRPQLNCLHGRLVTLPGGHDKDNRPFLLITLAPDQQTVDLVLPLQYMLSIFSQESRSKGFTVMVDARKTPWRTVRSSVRQVNTVLLPSELFRIIVVKPDGFWDKQMIENCTSVQSEKEVLFIPRSRLNKYIDQSQLPTELGGNFVYNHEKWLETRQKVEEFYTDSEITLKELDELHEYLKRSKSLRASRVEEAINTSFDMAEATRMLVHNSTEAGKDLVLTIEYDNRTRKLSNENFDTFYTPLDTLDTIDSIHKVISDIRLKQQEMEQEWFLMEKQFYDAKDLSKLEEGIVKVTNWILGPAENLLNHSRKVGYDVSSAEELRREHEAIELQCWDTYGTYAEITHKINTFSKNDNLTPQQKDLLSQKDFMDFVCRSFASRLERRRNILITSLRFFRMVSGYFDKTGEVFDTLIMGNNVSDFDGASIKLKQLQDSQKQLDTIVQNIRKEGEKLSDMLSMPVKDSLGRDVNVNYSEDIANIRDVLDATTARKNIFSDSVEHQKITLQQLTLIDQYERDVQEAVKWLDDILKILLRDHGHVGCTVYEIQNQKDEHQLFQETAKDVYNYGCQLLNTSLVLRQSCKLPLDSHAGLYQKLKSSWQKLMTISQEQMTRLRVSAVFYRSIEDYCNQLRELREAAATLPLMDVDRKKAKVEYYFCTRDKLMVDVGRMVRLGKLLRSQLKENLCSDEAFLLSSSLTTTPHDQDIYISTSCENNEIAIEAINEKLSEVSQLSEGVDNALRSAQQDCTIFSTTGTSTTSSSASDTSNSSICSLPKEFYSMESTSSNPGSAADRTQRSDDIKSEDDEFLTASDTTLQHSRSSSYNTASECDQHFSSWWEHGKDKMKDNISKEKMVLGVGLPELPPSHEVLKPSPEVPPGKIAREVTETTHIKVQQQHTMGVKSFVLTSETVRDNNPETCTIREERVRVVDEQGNEVLVPVEYSSEINEDDFMKRIKEVGVSDEEAWRSYRKVTKQAVRGFM